MKGNTKSCITSHRCSDREICNRCSPDPIRLLLRVHSPPPYILHKAQSGGGGGESLGRELMIIKPNAVNVVMVPAAVGSAAHITPTHSLTYVLRHGLRHGDKFGLLPSPARPYI